MRHFSTRAIKLEDCSLHGQDSGAELFLVEGDSAASAVTVLRNATFQATLPMQGKPLNARRASSSRILNNELYAALSAALGIAPSDCGLKSDPVAQQHADAGSLDSTGLAGLRYSKILLLFDPDADGIHIGALMLMYFHRWMRPLLASGRIELVRTPWFQLQWEQTGRPGRISDYAFSPGQCEQMKAELLGRGVKDLDIRHFRGLGSIDQNLLYATCICPASRNTQVVGVRDALAAIEVFGRGA